MRDAATLQRQAERQVYEDHLLAAVWPSRLKVIAGIQASALLVIALLFDLPLKLFGLFGVEPGPAGGIVWARLPTLLSPATSLLGLWLLRRGSRRAAWAGTLAVVLFTLTSDYGFFRLGYRGNALQALAYLTTIVVGQSFLPIRRQQRVAYFALASLGHVALELAFGSAGGAVERALLAAGLIVTSGYTILSSELLSMAEFAGFLARRRTEASLAQLRESRAQADLASRQLAEAVTQLGEVTGALQSRAGLARGGSTGIASGTEELAVGARRLSERARGAAEEMGAARAQTLELERLVGGADGKVSAILGAVDGSLEAFVRLEGSLTRIREFVDTIRDIESRTHVLALNASLEAARAGAFGRGFGVVAKQVLQLADHSRQSSATTREVVKAVAADLGATLATVEEVRTRTASFQSDFERVRAALASLLERYGRVDAAMEDSRAQAGDQARAVQQISEAARDIASLTEANAAASENLAATATRLDGLARGLRAMVEGG